MVQYVALYGGYHHALINEGYDTLQYRFDVIQGKQGNLIHIVAS